MFKKFTSFFGERKKSTAPTASDTSSYTSDTSETSTALDNTSVSSTAPTVSYTSDLTEDDNADPSKKSRMKVLNNADKTLRILFVAHQNRIRLSVINPFNSLFKELREWPINSNYKFSNCSILKLAFSKIFDKKDTIKISLDLIYSGDSSENK